ncbi:hypothetical protein ABT133_31270 [Streptomyces sp. NPDC001835]|uniref:hypothetical protein n=1 Tax=unclassified Streptomyces TaxID=2593676 RepID=UPI00332C101F
MPSSVPAVVEEGMLGELRKDFFRGDTGPVQNPGMRHQFLDYLNKLVLDEPDRREAEDFVPSGHSITEIADANTATTNTPPRPNREPETDVLVIDVVIDGNADQGIKGTELDVWLQRFTDPLHKRWAEQAWDELYSTYRVTHTGEGSDGKSIARSVIPFALARDIVQNIYRRGPGTGAAR